jgi:hypothetical protein
LRNTPSGKQQPNAGLARVKGRANQTKCRIELAEDELEEGQAQAREQTNWLGRIL